MEATTRYGLTPLQVAVANKAYLAARYLRESIMQARVVGDRGWLPLHDACLEGDVEFARFILERYPNTVNCTAAKENDQWTPLHMAAQNDCVDCIERLLTKNADITIRNNVDMTALHIAAEAHSCNALRLLRECQTDFSADDFLWPYDRVQSRPAVGYRFAASCPSA